MKFKLSCVDTNERHTIFNLFDPQGANCGKITILTTDIILFIGRDWNGDIVWNGFLPEPMEEGEEDESK